MSSINNPFRSWFRAWSYRLKREPCQIRFMLKHLRRGDIAIDIGAHKGAYTYWMYRYVAPTGHVYAFEPQYELAQSLKTQFSGKQRKDCVTIECLALSSSCGERTLHVPGMESSPSASLTVLGLQPGRTCPVKTDTLDAYCESHHIPKVRLIKCDVEGHELEVFQGGQHILKRLRPILLFECEARWRPDGRIEPVFAYLRSLGYQGWFFDAWGQLHGTDSFNAGLYQRIGLRPYLNNFVFIA